MAELIADSDELRYLARSSLTTLDRLSQAQRDVDQLLRGLDRRGWGTGTVDDLSGNARRQVSAVSDYLGQAPRDLERRAAILDELTGRPWPATFALTSWVFSDWMSNSGKYFQEAGQKPGPQGLLWWADKARDDLEEATSELIDVGSDLRREHALQIARMAKWTRATLKQEFRTPLLNFLRSDIGPTLKLGAGLKIPFKVPTLNVIFGVLDGVVAFAEDTDTNIGRRVTGAVGTAAGSIAYGLVVGGLVGVAIAGATAGLPVVAAIGIGVGVTMGLVMLSQAAPALAAGIGSWADSNVKFGPLRDGIKTTAVLTAAALQVLNPDQWESAGSAVAKGAYDTGSKVVSATYEAGTEAVEAGAHAVEKGTQAVEAGAKAAYDTGAHVVESSAKAVESGAQAAYNAGAQAAQAGGKVINQVGSTVSSAFNSVFGLGNRMSGRPANAW